MKMLKTISGLTTIVGLFVLLTACAITNVYSGKKLIPETVQVTKLNVVYVTPNFNTYNTAVGIALSRWKQFLPNLQAVTPNIFARNGVEAVVVDASVKLPDFRPLTLVVSMSSAVFQTGGASEHLEFTLVDTLLHTKLWTASGSMGSIAFGQFDEQAAKNLVSKIADRLTEDGLITRTVPIVGPSVSN